MRARFLLYPSSLLTVLGALACGDSMNTSTTSASRLAGDPNPPASPPSTQAAAPAAETPAAPSTLSPTSGSEQGPVNPVLQGGDTSPLNGSAPAAGASPTNAPVEASPAPSDPGAPVAASAPLTRESATGPGPLQVTTVSAGLRDGPAYGTQTLYVPQGAEPPFAAVAIVPGFNTPESSIQAWGPFLASHGIVALTIGTNTPTDSAELRSSALLDALVTIQAENTRAGSPLEGKLAADRLGIMGWSLGGGGTLIAASSTPSLKAAITMAAYGPGAQYPQDQVPTLFLAGSADRNAGGQSQGMFASLPSTTPKMLFEVQGGPHEIGNDPQNANGEIGRYGLSWLEVFLVGDDRYRQFLSETPTQASDFQQSLITTP